MKSDFDYSELKNVWDKGEKVELEILEHLREKYPNKEWISISSFKPDAELDLVGVENVEGCGILNKKCTYVEIKSRKKKDFQYRHQGIMLNKSKFDYALELLTDTQVENEVWFIVVFEEIGMFKCNITPDSLIKCGMSRNPAGSRRKPVYVVYLKGFEKV